MDIVRSYTPVFKSFAAAQDDADDEGGIHLLIKEYPDGAMTFGHLRLATPETVYRVAICRRGNLPYIRNYPICNTVFNHIYPVGSWIYLPYK